MSAYDPYRESARCCRRCGADLDGWYCDACGGSCLDAIAQAYVIEPGEPVIDDAIPVIEIGAIRVAA